MAAGRRAHASVRVLGASGPSSFKGWSRTRIWTLEELLALPLVERHTDIHCVTRWSMLGARFGGLPLSHLLDQVEPLSTARILELRSPQRTQSLDLTPPEEGSGPASVCCAHVRRPAAHHRSWRAGASHRSRARYFYKSIKWLERIELLAEDRLGYWEGEAGYHNEADPWKEQRYIASQLDAKTVRELLASRNFAGRSLMGLEVGGLDLTGLDARGALLRNADFRGSKLVGARFDARISATLI